MYQIDESLNPYVVVTRNARGMESRKLVLGEDIDKVSGVAKADTRNPFWKFKKAYRAELPDLHDALAGFDWYYMMSDDGRVYRAGERRKAELMLATAKIKGGDRLYQQWLDYINACTRGDDNPQKPERPE